MRYKSALMVIALLSAMFYGCMLDNLSDPSMSNQLQVYFSGKAMGVAINKYTPGADQELVAEWKALLKKYVGQEAIPPEEIVTFYDKSTSIISRHTPVGEDRYGLIADLKFILRLYGGSVIYTDPERTNGTLQLTEPVPVVIMYAFADGYVSGRSIAQRN